MTLSECSVNNSYFYRGTIGLLLGTPYSKHPILVWKAAQHADNTGQEDRYWPPGDEILGAWDQETAPTIPGKNKLENFSLENTSK